MSIGFFFQGDAWGHGFMMPPSGGMAPHGLPGGGMMPPPGAGGGMRPSSGGMMPYGRGGMAPPGHHGPYPGYGAYGQGNPWWGESYMQGWYMMPWMAGNANYDNDNVHASQSERNGSNSTGGYGSMWNNQDYGQYVPSARHPRPPPSDPGSDANAEFNCQNGFFYDSLTEKCEKQ